MKYVLVVIIFIFLGFALNAQDWQKYLPQDKLEDGTITLADYQQAFEQYENDFNADQYGYYYYNGEKQRVPGWKQFRRWEWQMQKQIDPITGQFPKTDAWTEWKKYLEQNPAASRSTYGDWTCLGPYTTPGGYEGLGRLNCIAFHPSDPNTFWVGAPTGGIWKTTVGGGNWVEYGDDNEIMGVSDIIIPDDFASSNTIYIATGDRDNYNGNSLGVLKSTDGGNTWQPTDLEFDRWDFKYVNRLLKLPGNDQTLYAATTAGIYKTTDGGTNFDLLYDVSMIDLEFHPTDPGIIYGSTQSNPARIYRSTDAGVTWFNELTISTGRRIDLAVSPNEPDWVYALVSNPSGGLRGIYRSLNSGDSWTLVYDGTIPYQNLLSKHCDASDTTGQGGYDLCINVNPFNALEVFLGGINTWKSTDGGVSWNIINVWTGDCGMGIPEVHADKHYFAFRPGTAELFECNDGGLYKSLDLGTTWADLSNGLTIGQIYRISTAQTVGEEILTGYQDVGSKLLSGSVWYDVGGGDGMDNLIKPDDEDVQFCSIQNGKSISRTNDHWLNKVGIRSNIPDTNKGAWVTPILLDPNNYNTLYVGLEDLWKSTDLGDNFTMVHDFPDGGEKLQHIAISPANSSKMAVSNSDYIWRSVTGGATWLNITNNIPSSGSILDITYHNTDENTFWICMSGYYGDRAYVTTDNGATFTSISEGLPAVPTGCIVQNNLVTAYDELYLATQAGVFVKVGDQPWLPFNANLPKVDCNWLTIYYDGTNSKLRCGTWGRGVWESDLFSIGAGSLCVWTGANSNDWWDGNNWNFYTVPDADSYVGIPEGCPNYPVISGAYVTVKELTVYPGATLNIGANLVTVNDNINMYGRLVMSDNTSALRAVKDLTWFAGSVVDIQGTSATIQVERDMVVASGAVLDFSNSTVFMSGGDYDSEIIMNSTNCSFNNLTLDKSSNRIVTFTSTYSLNKLRILGNFTIFLNNDFIFDSPADFFLNGSFTNYGIFEFINGAFKFAGGSITIAGSAGCYFNDLIIDGNTSTYLTLDFDAFINGDLDIIHGSLDPLSHNLYILGDWNNQEGDDGFIENTSNVIFRGDNWQVLSGNENFYRLTLHTTGPGISIQDGTIECEEYDWTSGTLEVTTGGTFIAQDLFDEGIKGNFDLTTGGNIELHSSTYTHLKGNVTISGGSFDVYGGIVHSAWPSMGDASLTMSGGEFTFHDYGIYMITNAYNLDVDMTGGSLRTGGYLIINNTAFDPTGGTIELIGNNAAHIDVDPGISLPELIINKTTTTDNISVQNEVVERIEYPATDHMKGHHKKALPPGGNRSGTITVMSDLDITGQLLIENGEFDVDAYTVTVDGDVNIYGTLVMNDPGGLLVANQDVTFYPGSDASVTDGDIHLKGDWYFNDGTDAVFTGSHVVVAMGTTAQVLHNEDDNASMHTLTLLNTLAPVEIDAPYNKSFRASGNVVCNANTELLVTDSLWVGDYFNVQSTALATVDGGDLHCNHGMALHGTLDHEQGDVRILQDFIFGTSGVLNIIGAAANFYLDIPYTGSPFEFTGTTNLSSGALIITNNGVLINNTTSLLNMTGGVLKVGEDFNALFSLAFQPMAGKVLLTGSLPAEINVTHGNYFNELIISKQPSNVFCAAADSIIVQGDLWISNGGLIMYGNKLKVLGDLQIDDEGWLTSDGYFELAGDWTNDHGEDGFAAGTSSTVCFAGTSPSSINNTETFNNIFIDKTLGSGEYLTLAIGDTIKSVDSLEIRGGALRLQEDCCIEAHDLSIQAGAGLIVDTLEYGIEIYVTGDWDNQNDGYTTNTGFSHGNSTAHICGTGTQALSSTGGEQFYKFHLDKINGTFEPAFDMTFIGDCYVDDGAWGTGAGSLHLNHTYFKDLEIANAAQWVDSNCRLKFVGDEGQWIKNYMYPTLVIWDLIVDEPTNVPYAYLVMVGDIRCRNWAHVMGGELGLNGNTLSVDVRVQVDAGAGITGTPNSKILMADNGTIFPYGGRISMCGSEAFPCLISNQGSGYYDFNVVSGGYFNAYHTVVEYLDIWGVHFYNGGLADTTYNYEYCTFRNGATGGTLLRFYNDQDLEFLHVNFPDTPVSGIYNVTKPNDAGSVSLNPAYGYFAGEDYESDPYSRVTWNLGSEWIGAVSTDWHTAGNWVNDMVPIVNNDVLIPDGTPYDPIISTAQVAINSLLLESGANLTLDNYYLLLYGDSDIWGTLSFNGNEDLIVFEDLYFRPGCGVVPSATCEISIYGDLIIEEGSNLDITGGYTNFKGSDTSRLICLDDSATVFQLRINKSSGAPFYFDGSSTGDLFINSFFYNMSGNVIYGDAPINVYLNRSYINNGGHLYCDSTHFVFNGNAALMPFKMMPGDYLQDLTIESTTHLDVDLTYSDTINIRGDFEINNNPSGSSGMDANGAYMIMGGNWINNVGSSAFIHGDNTVEFYHDETPLIIEGENQFYGLIDNTEGYSSLTLYESNEVERHFDVNHHVILTDELYVTYTMTLQDPNANLVLSSGSYSEVGYLTQGGTITCNSSDFYAFDIRDDYLLGTYILNGGYIEIQQDASDRVDLGADITITDGLMAIYGGSGISKWPAQVSGAHPTLTISGGQLYIASQGIEIEDNSGAYSITENITGGTIRTNSHFYCRGTATGFSPTGGVVELTGNVNSDCEVCDSGNALWILKINKNTGNAVKNSNEINVKHEVIIHNGILSDMGKPIHVGQ